MEEYKMQTVLITGASSGIGKAFAYEFAKRGYHLIITSRRKDLLDCIAEELKVKYKICTTVIPQDLSEEHSAKKLVSEINLRNLQVDILVNNAGFATKGLLSSSDYDKQHKEMNLNVIALTELTYLLIGKMAERKNGTIINISSVSGFNPSPFNAVYSATKAYVLSFSQSINYEYKDKGVHIIAVCPQSTNTHFFDNFNKMKGKMREPEDVVESTFKAILKKKSICTDGQLSLLQSLMPHFLSRKMCVTILGYFGKSIWGKQEVQ
jgi:short-subunit dehydrogenase